MSVFYNNFVRQCNLKGVAPSKAGQDVGVSSAAVSGWGNGSIPRKAVLSKLAQYFDCAVDDFFKEGSEEDKKITATSGDGNDYLNKRMEYVKSLFSQLTEQNQIQAISDLQSRVLDQLTQDAPKESD